MICSTRGILFKFCCSRFVLFSVFLTTNIFFILPWLIRDSVPKTGMNILENFLGNISFSTGIAKLESMVYEAIGNKLSELFPVDIVYTWVNGSEPLFIREMQRYLSPNDEADCEQENCFQSAYYYIRQNDYELDDKDFIASLGPMAANNSDESFWIFKLPVNRNIYEVFRLVEKETMFSIQNQLFWTSDSANGKNFKITNAFLMKMKEGHLSQRCLQQLLGSYYLDIQQNCQFHFFRDKCVLECSSSIQNTIDNLIEKLNDTIHILPAHLSPSINRETYTYTDYEFSRFHDNNELLYSLRSVEQYMPWVRNIFLLTNGQVPGWLNISHPKVRLVTHEDIFLNQSHLPTFSSVAIEANIHRIPELSENFIYFNDDIFLNQNVHLTDFYTPNEGYKFYMIFKASPCNKDCSLNMIDNGKCDEECNTNLCSYDGGDCAANLHPVEVNNKVEAPHLCAPMCFDELLGNLKCNEECNLKECGFDSGDCGIQYICQILPEIKIPTNGIVQIPDGLLAAWINLSSFSDEYKIEPVYPLLDGIKSLSVIAEGKVGVVVFRSNFRMQMISFNLFNEDKVSKIIFIIKSNANTEDECSWNIDYKSSPELTGNIYIKSLLYTNKIFNEKYGFHQRSIPGHVPLFINKRALEEMQYRIPEEFELSSSRRFRSTSDMQFYFSYSTFIISERIGQTTIEVFDAFDIDQSGYWSQKEIDLFRERFYLSTYNEKIEFTKTVENCCEISVCNVDMIELKLQDILNCPSLKEKLYENKDKLRYKFQIASSNNVSEMVLITSNIDDLLIKLSQIRQTKRNFINFNNDMKSGKIVNGKIFGILNDYLESKFPNPSSFELTYDAELIP